MTINYSPYFDSSVYIDYAKHGNTLTGEHYLGDLGLLSEMELRLGLTRVLPSEEKREVDFYKVLDSYLKDHSDSFIKRSFDLDSLSVSKELLRWRDELILCGWNIKFSDSNKLRLLADLEQRLPEKTSVKSGFGDRWQCVLKAPKDSLRSLNIVVHFPEEHVAPHILKLFSELGGVSIEYTNYSTSVAKKDSDLQLIQKSLIERKGIADISGDGSLKVVEFDDYTQAIEWVGASNPKINTVYVNKDNRRLDDFQMSMSNAASGASLSSTNPEVAQLFKLGCSLLMEPLNIYNLLAYLQVSVNPLPYRLRKKLIEVITEEGGVLNEKWNKVIDDYVNEVDDDGKSNSKKKRKKLNLLPVGGERRRDAVPREAVINYVMELSKWASQRKALIRSDSESVPNSELVIAQLGALVDFCSALSSSLTGKDEFVSNENLERWIRTIYRPKNYPYSTPELEGLTVVPSPASLADPTANLIWLDCFTGDNDRNPISFLTDNELKYLTDNGVYPWNWTDQIEARMFSFKMAVLTASESVTLVVSRSDTGKQVPKHPIVTTIMELCSKSSKDKLVFAANEIDKEKLVSIKEEPLPEPINYVRLNDGLAFIPRIQESYSSLEKLIEYPIDYVLRYMLGLRDNSTQSITNLNLTIGNVAHLVVETLVERFQNASKVLANIDEKFDGLFDDAVTQAGAILLLKENTIECAKKRTIDHTYNHF